MLGDVDRIPTAFDTTSGQIWLNLSRSRPTLVRFVGKLGQASANRARFRAKFAQCWPTLARAWTKLAQFRPNLVDRVRPDVGQRPGFGQVWACSTDSDPTLANLCQDSVNFWPSRPTLAVFGPSLQRLRPTSADLCRFCPTVGRRGTFSTTCGGCWPKYAQVWKSF